MRGFKSHSVQSLLPHLSFIIYLIDFKSGWTEFREVQGPLTLEPSIRVALGCWVNLQPVCLFYCERYYIQNATGPQRSHDLAFHWASWGANRLRVQLSVDFAFPLVFPMVFLLVLLFDSFLDQAPQTKSLLLYFCFSFLLLFSLGFGGNQNTWRALFDDPFHNTSVFRNSRWVVCLGSCCAYEPWSSHRGGGWICVCVYVKVCKLVYSSKVVLLTSASNLWVFVIYSCWRRRPRTLFAPRIQFDSSSNSTAGNLRCWEPEYSCNFALGLLHWCHISAHLCFCWNYRPFCGIGGIDHRRRWPRRSISSSSFFLACVLESGPVPVLSIITITRISLFLPWNVIQPAKKTTKRKLSVQFSSWSTRRW